MKESFSPLFSNIVDSSLWEEPDFVCKVFVTLLALKDHDQVSRTDAYKLGRKCWPNEPDRIAAEKKAAEALEVLMAPDKRRFSPQKYDGRRIEKVEDGYLILNGEFYEDMMRKVSDRVRKARWARDNRAKGKKTTLRGENGAVKEYAKTGDKDKLAERATESLPVKPTPRPTPQITQPVPAEEREWP